MAKPITSPKTPLKHRRRRRIIVDASHRNLRFDQLLENIAIEEGKPIKDAAMKNFLYRVFGTTAWPLPEDKRIPRPYDGPGKSRLKPQTITKVARERLDTLTTMSKEGNSKTEAMERLGLNEIAFNRFLHRHFGSVIWPIGGKPVYTSHRPAKRERDSEAFTTAQMGRLTEQGLVLVPIEVTDAILARYIERKVRQGLPLQTVFATLRDVKACWAEITSLCVDMAGTA